MELERFGCDLCITFGNSEEYINGLLRLGINNIDFMAPHLLSKKNLAVIDRTMAEAHGKMSYTFHGTYRYPLRKKMNAEYAHQHSLLQLMLEHVHTKSSAKNEPLIVVYHLFGRPELMSVQMEMFKHLQGDFGGKIDFAFELLSKNHSGPLPYLQDWNIVQNFIANHPELSLCWDTGHTRLNSIEFPDTDSLLPEFDSFFNNLCCTHNHGLHMQSDGLVDHWLVNDEFFPSEELSTIITKKPETIVGMEYNYSLLTEYSMDDIFDNIRYFRNRVNSL